MSQFQTYTTKSAVPVFIISPLSSHIIHSRVHRTHFRFFHPLPSPAFLCPSLSKRTFTAIMSTTSTSNKYRISHEIHPYAYYSQFIIDGEFSDRWQLFDSSLSRGSISDTCISTCSIDAMQGDVATTPDPDMNLKNPNQQNSPRPEISSNVFATDNYYPKKLEHPSRTMPKTIARKTKNCPPRRNMANAAA